MINPTLTDLIGESSVTLSDEETAAVVPKVHPGAQGSATFGVIVKSSSAMK